jgi:3-phenylpropionate/trans-cinnamate dioxygenase ferredoxin reductase subunit
MHGMRALPHTGNGMNEQTGNLVIIGGGYVASQVSSVLRRSEFQGAICIVGDEAFLPYQRPPLSKRALAGQLTEQALALRSPDFYKTNRIEVLTGKRALAIDRPARRLVLDDGATIAYDKAVIATGSRMRTLTVPGADAAGICYLRTIEDLQTIRQRLADTRKVAIVGGGFIGLEVAATLRELGKEVTLLEVQDRLMARAVSKTVSDFYFKLHTSRGVRIRLGTRVLQIMSEDGGTRKILCDDGETCTADLIIAGIGGIPNDDIAASAGLACDNGVLVDEYLTSSDPDILAAGDCANFFNLRLQRRQRLESVQNAMDQGNALAELLCGRRKPYDALPWFWSDQFNTKLQIAGMASEYDEVVCAGDTGKNAFTCFYGKNGRLVAAESVNRISDHMICKRLLSREEPVSMHEIRKHLADLRALEGRT